MTNRVNIWVKNKIKELKEKSKCSMCSSRKNLEFHHIKKTKLNGESRGRKERYYDIINNPDCYICLCKKHHRGNHYV